MKTKRTTRSKQPRAKRQVAVSLDSPVYERLRSLAGRRSVSNFIKSLIAQPHSRQELDAGYRAASANQSSEAEALAWSEAMIGDIADEAG